METHKKNLQWPLQKQGPPTLWKEECASRTKNLQEKQMAGHEHEYDQHAS